MESKFHLVETDPEFKPSEKYCLFVAVAEIRGLPIACEILGGTVAPVCKNLRWHWPLRQLAHCLLCLCDSESRVVTMSLIFCFKNYSLVKIHMMRLMLSLGISRCKACKEILESVCIITAL